MMRYITIILAGVLMLQTAHAQDSKSKDKIITETPALAAVEKGYRDSLKCITQHIILGVEYGPNSRCRVLATSLKEKFIYKDGKPLKINKDYGLDDREYQLATFMIAQIYLYLGSQQAEHNGGINPSVCKDIWMSKQYIYEFWRYSDRVFPELVDRHALDKAHNSLIGVVDPASEKCIQEGYLNPEDAQGLNVIDARFFDAE